MVAVASRYVLDHLDSLSDQLTADLDSSEELFEHLREPIPEEPTPFPDLVEFLFEDAIPRSINAPHPGNLSYIPAGGLFHSAVADFIADATNRYVGTWHGAPALARIEANVVEWFCEMVDYPGEAFGLLTTGGSMANLVATVTARSEHLPLEFLDGVVYTSDQSHHSVRKAAVVAGFPPGNVRSIPTDDEYRIRPDALEAAIEDDRNGSGRPFMVVATAGSTNTGAVDDLEALGDLCEREDLWLHADAAYGGFFVLTGEGRRRLAGLSRCDSITLDPHKGLFLPYGTGAVLVRDGAGLTRAHSASADYMTDWDVDSGFVDFSQMGPELSRDVRGLRVWLPLRMHGIAPFEAALEEKLELARWVADALADTDYVRVVAHPQLSTLAFRVEPPDVDGDELDAVNRRVLAAVNGHDRVHLSATTLDGRFTPRVSVLSFRTHREHVEHCVADVRSAVRTVVD